MQADACCPSKMKILILAITHDHQRVLVGSELELSDLVQKTEAFEIW
jgi:hypothetical protein